MSARQRRCRDCANLEQFCICAPPLVVAASTELEHLVAGAVAPLGRPTRVPYLRVIDGGA